MDTLDLGVYVITGVAGYDLLDRLLQLREQARSTRAEVEFPDPMYPGRVYPTGGKSMYDLHVHAEGIGEVYWRTGAPIEGTPDVFVSVASQTLWLDGGVAAAVNRLSIWLAGLGFHVLDMKPSRCDLAMDLLVPGGFTQDWLDAHLCTQAEGDDAKRLRRMLTGFRIGSRASPIFVRIYDKTREIHEQSEKWWFWDAWQGEYREDVWRLEFELKREFFRSLRPSIDTTSALLSRLPDFWGYLTGSYLTFRANTGKRMARREVLPLSKAIREQGCRWLGATGPTAPLDRRRGHRGSWEHARRDQRRLCVRACALHGIEDPNQALELLGRDIVGPDDREEFLRDVRRKRRKLGVPSGDAPAAPATAPESQP